MHFQTWPLDKGISPAVSLSLEEEELARLEPETLLIQLELSPFDIHHSNGNGSVICLCTAPANYHQ